MVTEAADLSRIEEKAPQATRYILRMFQGDGDAAHGEISRHVVEIIQRKLDKVVTTKPEQTAIDVWLHSPGGDAHAAYKLYLDLAARAGSIRVVIPDYAKSAATLLALGFDEIFMTPAAELGPLDVQLEHPDKEGVVVSGLDIAGALESLGQTALSLVIFGGSDILNITGLPRAEILPKMLDFSAQFLRPAVAKLDPQIVHRANSQLLVAKHYAERMLSDRASRCSEEIDHEEAQEIARRLVNQYPAHGFVIGPKEAAELGLPVAPAANYDGYATVERAFVMFRRNLSGTSMIDVSKYEDVEKEFSDTTPTGLSGGTNGLDENEEEHAKPSTKSDNGKPVLRQQRSGSAAEPAATVPGAKG